MEIRGIRFVQVAFDAHALDQVTLEIRLVAQILESLRVAFTDNIGFGIPVKDVYELPWVAVRNILCYCSIIELNRVAYFLLICFQLIYVAVILIRQYYICSIIREGRRFFRL